ncbi:DUF5132 domain-containing protein [Rhodoblastus sp.]|uniref:DUF5132 domain-containing protein n=1 Tax=Rhodoblastus sp. TaxID=1962975 RepID=UPI003F9CF0C1
MNKPAFDTHEAAQSESAVGETEHDVDDELNAEETNLVATVATVGVIGVGVAVFEATLLPGLVLGVAAMAAPKFVPKIGSALGSMFKSTVRGVYKFGQKTREFVAEANEHVQDIVAEVDAETKGAPTPAKESAPAEETAPVA